MLWHRQQRLESRLVWIFGSPRSGSTWLLNLIAADPSVAKVDEPWIAGHLGLSVGGAVGLNDNRRVIDARADWPDYFFAERHRKAWAAPLRRLVLARFAESAHRRRWVVIKEPLSEAADTILSLLPRSRVLFLLRDGRDVVDSELDGVSEGGWILKLLDDPSPVEDRLAYVQARSRAWLRRTEVVQAAYQAHDPKLRICVRYEELLADPAQELRRIAVWLQLDESRLLTASDAMKFERLSARGPGQFVRAAAPGSWQHNMNEEERRAMGEILDERLAALGYD